MDKIVDQGLTDAYKLKVRALSYKFAAEEALTLDAVELVHNKGFGMIIWVVNEPADIEAVWAMEPDFIQTNNPNLRTTFQN